MDKKEIIDIIESLHFHKLEYYVSDSSALVLYEIKKYCSIINLYVSEELFYELKNAGKINLNNIDEDGFYKLTDEVCISYKKRKNFECRMEKGFQLETLKALISLKKKRNDESDINDIKKIEEYMKKNNIKFDINVL